VRKINRAVKIRIYPNKEQITQIEKTIGCSRFLYNRMLADKIRYYQEEKKMLKNTPAGYKKEYPWLKEVDSLALANLSAGQVPEAAKDAAGKNKTPPYDPGGMEAEISDCEQGTVREIFCQPAVRL